MANRAYNESHHESPVLFIVVVAALFSFGKLHFDLIFALFSLA
jgi:hypothetical protein